MKKRMLYLCLLFSLAANAMAGGGKARFERISIAQGLSLSSVYCLVQDQRGFMWFGTEDGLNRFDGYQ
ncbi:MAG: hypothetical protein MUF02_09560, partial [Acidobacteria bacterium]|nr:hypothetical protein [Acidobacteriota bacterium]